MNWNLFLQYLIIGVASGSIIALIALGYTLVYGIVELINFAHGDVFMLGAFFAFSVVTWTGVTGDSSFAAIAGVVLLTLAATMLFSGTLNFAIDRIAYRRMRNSPRLVPLIAAIGISFILQNIGIYWKGPNPITPPKIIPAQYRSYNILEEWFGYDGVRLRPLDVVVIVVTIPLLVGLTWFIYKTKTGKAMRATAQDRDAAALMGVDINRAIATAFLIGGSLAGAAGVIVLYYNNSARYQMGFRYGLFAFTAAVLGGIGNMLGAVVGGLFIGIVWAMSDGYVKEFVPGWGAQWTTSVIFGLLVLIMIFRPTGFFGEPNVDKV